MAGLNHKEIARMEWNEFEDRLQTATRGGRRGGGSDDKALREYFGDQEYEELRAIAQRSQAMRSRGPLLGNIVLLPGIMGSNLISTENEDEDLIWVNLLRLAAGRMARLRLSPDGSRDADGSIKVSASIIDKRTYSRTVLKLRARWDVQPFAFDWRKDIDVSSDALANFIRNRFKDKPVHLVAHSMGGLVSRNFIRRHKDVWEKMRGDGGQGGRLIMLGTPNYGSFTIPQVLTGVEKLVRWLSKADLRHSLVELIEIINTFVGTYEMLPSPEKIPQSIHTLYRKDIWGSLPVSEKHLNRAREFHEELRDPATINPERMIYIAGCNRRTLSGIEIISPGEFRYFETLDGDGRVPFALGLLDNIRTYYVDEDHGSLPKNDKVLTAVDELLQHGITSVLPEQPIMPRAVITAGRWHRSIGEYQIGSDLENYARLAEKEQISPDEQRVAEETIMRAIMGSESPARDVPAVASKKPRAGKKYTSLHVEVIRGDVTDIEAPIVAVGQYKGVTPINAVGALDKALGYWISQAIKFSMVGSELGQLFFIPVNRGQIRADAVLLAGMGDEGKFSQDDLRYLMLNVTYGVSAMDVDRFATVLIGSGAGNLKEERAIRAMLFGICDALHRLPEKQRLKHVILIEKNKERYDNIWRTMEIIMNEDSAANLDIKVTHRELPPKKGRKPQVAAVGFVDQRKAGFEPRVTIERDGDMFKYSALTQNAVIPVREVEIQSFFPDGIAERLMRSTNQDEQQKFGRLLNTTLIPEDFKEILESPEPLTLILDRSTASIPWEMACFSRPAGTSFFGTHLYLTRQFRTHLSAAPGIAPPAGKKLRVLVIADPAPEEDYQLPGARLEGRAVVHVLGQIKQDWGLDIEVIDRIGDAECDPVEILSLILDGGFDVVHYAGHGIFDEKNPSHGGWVFGENRYLTAREIFRARRVPRMIFANACFSAVVNRDKANSAADLNRHLAGIAEAFFERGVQNYIGTGWPVQDDLAVKFATTFYENALTGQTLNIFEQNGKTTSGQSSQANFDGPKPRTLGESISEARSQIIHNGSTWGAYHHYGQASELLMPVMDRSGSAKSVQSDKATRKKRARKAGTKSTSERATVGKRSKSKARAGKK